MTTPVAERLASAHQRIFRTKIVVVGGDEKQMPPTSFFASKVENDEAAIFDGEEPEDAANEEERNIYTETWNGARSRTAPICFSSLVQYCNQEPFRSEYRELISFSNASFYGIRAHQTCRLPHRRRGSHDGSGRAPRFEEQSLAGLPRSIGIVDDVLTTGLHFRAIKDMILERLPDHRVVGFFEARRAIPSPFENVSLEELLK